MDRAEKIEFLQLLEEKERRIRYNSIRKYFPETGPLRRELYVKHMKFFKAGVEHKERLMLAANRIGKTESVGGYEVVCHLTGIYPEWWTGARFDKPIKAWAAGDTSQTVRDILQMKLLGDYADIGSGLIPKSHIISVTPKTGVPQAYETIRVKHISGGASLLGFKSYDQKRKSFQGTEQDVIWLDEEPPLEIYTECLMRTMTNDGIILNTFTPLSGISETVMHFLPKGDFTDIENDGSKFVIMADWDDAPHLTKEQKDTLWASIPPYQRDARSKGIPQLGSGVIYPVPEADITIDDFEIPTHWPKLYAMDVGWNNTAGAWLTKNRETGECFIYSVYKRGEVEPPIHAEAFKARGEWIPGKIDPAARGRAQADGYQLLEAYTNLGLKVTAAQNAVEAGIYKVWEMLSTGKLKVFKSCKPWFEEARIYRRDEKGRIVKANDHIMDCTRYVCMSIEEAVVKPIVREATDYPKHHFGQGVNGWMG